MSCRWILGTMSAFALYACSEAEDSKPALSFETSGAGISHGSTGAFSTVPIPAGTTIWFNSEVRYSGVPNQVVHLYSNGARITFTAGGVNYNLTVPDGVVTIDPRLASASTTFTAGTWQTNVPMRYAGQTFVSGVAWVTPVALPGSISNVNWTTNLQSEVSFSLSWQWSAATYSSFTADMTLVGAKPIDNQWINPYANSDTAGTPENFKNRLVAGARTGGGTNYIGVPVTSAAFAPDTPCAGVICTPNAQCQTASSCDVRTGQCVGTNRPNGAACSDGNACTTVDSCQSGACVGAGPVVCVAADQCHVAGTCDPSSGVCGNPSAANGTACSDGNACTTLDSCQSGACVGTSPVVCAASDQCHVAGTCDPSSGLCSNPSAANGTACSDGNLCTTVDSCIGGACVGASPVVCIAADPCHVAGTCNSANGQCSNPAAANGTACTDGNACTQSDSCQGGACVGTNPLVCTASDQCHLAGTCNPESGQCSDPIAANGTACSDGNGCTQSDSCVSGVCTGASPVSCTGTNQCFTASCEPATGLCEQTHVAGACCGDGVCDASESGETCPGDCWLRTLALAGDTSGPCALLDDGSIRCLGANDYGQRGIGSTVEAPTWVSDGNVLPRVRLGSGHSAIALSSSYRHVCAILDDHSLKCWGENFYGCLGLGDAVHRGRLPEDMGDALPTVDLGAGARVMEVSAGQDTTCAILEDHRLKCWGFGGNGDLGLGDTATRGNRPGQMGDALPAVNFGPGRYAVHVLAAFRTCAILDDQSVRCWGSDLGNQPGPPLDTGGHAILDMAAAGPSLCFLRDDHQIACFGWNNAGQLGLGDRTIRAAPTTPVDLGTGRTALDLWGTYFGGPRMCALLDDHSVKCWSTTDAGIVGSRPGQMGDALPRVPLPLGRTAATLGAQRSAILDDQSSYQWASNATYNWGLKLRCGNGHLDSGEACDDGDLRNGDGCSSTCTVEPGFSCSSEPSYCRTTCGDGVTAGSELCDDGALAPDDGCSPSCTIERGWRCLPGVPCTRLDVQIEVLGAYVLGQGSWWPETTVSTLFAICNSGADDGSVRVTATSTLGPTRFVDTFLNELVVNVPHRSCISGGGVAFVPGVVSHPDLRIHVVSGDPDPSNDDAVVLPRPADPLLAIGLVGTVWAPSQRRYVTSAYACNLGSASVNGFAAPVLSLDAALDGADAVGPLWTAVSIAPPSFLAGSCFYFEVDPGYTDPLPGTVWFGVRVSADATVDSSDPGGLGGPTLVGPDYVIRSVTANLDASGNLNVATTVCNDGHDLFAWSGPDSLSLSFQASGDADPASGVEFLHWTGLSPTHLMAGRCHTWTRNVLPNQTGPAHLFVTVESPLDADSGNNTATIAVDLVSDAAVQFDGTAWPPLQFQVCNRGNYRLEHALVDLLVSTDPIVDANDPTLSEVLGASALQLEVGPQSPEQCTPVIFPAEVIPMGSVWVAARVTSDLDSNPSNNISSTVVLGEDLSADAIYLALDRDLGIDDDFLYIAVYISDVPTWGTVPRGYTLELIASEDDVLDATDTTISTQPFDVPGMYSMVEFGPGFVPPVPAPAYYFARVTTLGPAPELDLSNNVVMAASPP